MTSKNLQTLATILGSYVAVRKTAATGKFNYFATPTANGKPCNAAYVASNGSANTNSDDGYNALTTDGTTLVSGGQTATNTFTLPIEVDAFDDTIYSPEDDTSSDDGESHTSSEGSEDDSSDSGCNEESYIVDFFGKIFKHFFRHNGKKDKDNHKRCN